MSHQKLKSLQVRETQIKDEVDGLFKDRKTLDKKISDAMKRLSAVKKNIKELTKTKPQLSEHAILRYLERKKGIDINEIKSKIMDDKVVKQIKTIGSGKIRVDDFILVVRNNVVVTVEN